MGLNPKGFIQGVGFFTSTSKKKETAAGLTEI
jgi:hypothetical protein